MDVLISLLGIIVTILFVIGTHEAAHFIVARLLGVKVLRFSIGFGRTLFRWRDKKQTEYVIALFPLGGYVKMLDETEGDVSPQEAAFAYNRQPFYKKFLIILAGPAANIFCALALYWLIFTIGFISVKPVIGSVQPHSIAADAGLQKNQEIIKIDHQPILSWTSLIFRLMAHLGNQDHLDLETINLNNNKINSHHLDMSNWHLNELKPDPLDSLGITPYEPVVPLIIGEIVNKSPAAASLLKVGDKIIAINKVKIQTWQALSSQIYAHPNTTVVMTLERSGKVLQLPVTIGAQRDLFFQQHGILGIAPHFTWPKNLLNTVKYNPIAAIPRAWQEITDFTYLNFIIFGKMFSGKLSLRSLGGPITIFETAGDAFHTGFVAYIAFLAFLSISIGIINLLPIPGLDGGHLLLQFIEWVIGRPIPQNYLLLLFRLGFIFIFFILIQALINDILRL